MVVTYGLLTVASRFGNFDPQGLPDTFKLVASLIIAALGLATYVLFIVFVFLSPLVDVYLLVCAASSPSHYLLLAIGDIVLTLAQFAVLLPAVQ